jgi:CBS domain-containing protein
MMATDLKCPYCGADTLPGDERCSQCLHSMMVREMPKAGRGDTIQQALLSQPVSELLTGADLLVCEPEDSVQKIVDTFNKSKKGCVLVYKNKKMVGILSNRDLLLRVVGKYDDLSKVKVAEVMTHNPGFVRPQDPMAYAVNKMSMGGYRHVPVIREDGTPVSILLIKDVLRYLSWSKKAY